MNLDGPKCVVPKYSIRIVALLRGAGNLCARIIYTFFLPRTARGCWSRRKKRFKGHKTFVSLVATFPARFIYTFGTYVLYESYGVAL